MTGGLGILIAVVGSLGGLGVLAGVFIWLRAWLRRTLLSRRDTARKLNQIACGVTTAYMDSLLGPPPFCFSGPQDKADKRPEPALLAVRVYWLKHAWLQVTAGFDGSVRAFSITVTDPRFKFRTAHLMFEQLDISLGATRFREVMDSPDGWLSRTGARRFAYAESHWFGNPGSYQVYVLGCNDAGTGHYELPPPFVVPDPLDPRRWSGGRLCPETGSAPSWEPLPGWLQAARDQTTVNTLTVLGPTGDTGIIQGWPGVDGDQVRLLRQAIETRETRRLRRKIRKQMRRTTEQGPDLPGEPDPVQIGEA